MQQKTSTCQFCNNEYTPRRRRVQRFCSNKCRASFHRFKKKTSITIATKKTAPVELQQHNELKKEQFVNPSQVFNAALGAGAAALIQNVFTPESKKPATKEDLANLASGTKRYHLVKNRPPNQLGQYLYFDLEKGELVYLNTFK